MGELEIANRKWRRLEVGRRRPAGISERRPLLGLKEMRLTGERIKKTRFVRAGRFVVAVDVEAVIPREDSTEPCFESETVRLLKEVERHAESGDVAWLKKHGMAYELVEA